MNKLTDLFRGTGGRGMAIGLALLSLQLIAIVFAPWIAPYSPITADPLNSLQPPSWPVSYTHLTLPTTPYV